MAEQSTNTPGIITRRDLGGTEIERRAETAATAAAAQERAKMEFRYLMALRYPRDWEEVRLAILKECDRPFFAREALYNKPIGKGVIGLSIRFAEKALTCMRNVGADTVVTFDNDQKRIVCQMITDYESNVTFSKDVTIEKTVERREVRDGQEVVAKRMNSRGVLVYLVRATEDDLLNKEGALVSKAMRTNVLRILPGDIQSEAIEKIQKVLADQDAQDPEGRKNAMLSAFFTLGVKPKEVAEYIGHELDVIKPGEFSALVGLHNAIKDGETTMRQAIAFAKEQRGEKPSEGDEKKPETAAGKIAEKLKQKRRSQTPHPESTEAGAPTERTSTQSEQNTTTGNTVAAADAGGGVVSTEGGEVASGPAGGATLKFDPKSTAAKLEVQLVELSGGSVSRAQVALSEATAGKCQTFIGLADMLVVRPDFAPMIQSFIDSQRRQQDGRDSQNPAARS